MSNYLVHYASKYYDPVKAHEYYEAHKQLKGRRSSAKLNEQGKEVWSSVKSNIQTEKKTEVKRAEEARKRQIKLVQDQAKRTREQIQRQFAALGRKLSDLDKAQRDKQMQKVATELASAIDKAKAQFLDTKSTLNTTYESKLDEEYDKIAKEYGAKKKGRKGAKSSKSKAPDKYYGIKDVYEQKIKAARQK